MSDFNLGLYVNTTLVLDNHPAPESIKNRYGVTEDYWETLHRLLHLEAGDIVWELLVVNESDIDLLHYQFRRKHLKGKQDLACFFLSRVE